MSEKNIIATADAPAAIGPYSQACACGNLIFLSGQIALDPATGVLVGADAAAQTHQALTNAKAVLEAAGSSMDLVLKSTVFLADIRDFDAMNGVYASFFRAGKYPARSAVQVANLPKGALVEIELIAAKG